MTVKVPQQVDAYLTPEQIKALEDRYRTKNASDALGALLLAMAGLFVIAQLADDTPKRPRRRKT